MVAALSLATDMGTGQPLERGLRTCLLALRLGQIIGLSAEELQTVYYVALLRFVGCTADGSADRGYSASGWVGIVPTGKRENC